MKVEYRGIGTIADDVEIHFTIGEQAARRFMTVRVPANEFRHDEVKYLLHRAEAKRLRAYWEGQHAEQEAFFDV